MARGPLIAATLALTCCFARGGEAYPDAARRYWEAAQEVLIERKVCADAQDCYRKDLLFWEGGNPWLRSHRMAFVLLYETNDHALFDAVLARLAQVRGEASMPPVKLITYKSRHMKRKVTFAEAVLK